MNAQMTDAGRVHPGRLLSCLQKCGITIALTAVCLFIAAVHPAAEWLTWQRSDPLGPLLWLSHLSHWSWGHLLWDLLMFTCMAAVIESVDRRLLARLLLAAPPVIVAATWLLEHHTTYRGLSGLDCTLYAALLVTAVRRSWIPLAPALLFSGLLAGKCAYEILTGSTLFVSDLPAGVTAVPWAHLSGAAAGTVIALCRGWTRPASPGTLAGNRSLGLIFPGTTGGGSNS